MYIQECDTFDLEKCHRVLYDLVLRLVAECVRPDLNQLKDLGLDWIRPLLKSHTNETTQENTYNNIASRSLH